MSYWENVVRELKNRNVYCKEKSIPFQFLHGKCFTLNELINHYDYDKKCHIYHAIDSFEIFNILYDHFIIDDKEWFSISQSMSVPCAIHILNKYPDKNHYFYSISSVKSFDKEMIYKFIDKNLNWEYIFNFKIEDLEMFEHILLSKTLFNQDISYIIHNKYFDIKNEKHSSFIKEYMEYNTYFSDNKNDRAMKYYSIILDFIVCCHEIDIDIVLFFGKEYIHLWRWDMLLSEEYTYFDNELFYKLDNSIIQKIIISLKI